MKKINFRMLLTAIVIILTLNAKAQVTIGSEVTPPAGALLNLDNVSGVKKGLLLPLVALPADLTQWGLDGSSIDGMVVYNTFTGKEGVYVRVKGVWVPMTSSDTDATIKDIDNNVYTATTYGTAGTWLDQNMKATKAPDGTPLNPVKHPDAPADYGLLYTQDEAVKVCPQGWGLPTDEEFYALEVYLDSEYNDASIGVPLNGNPDMWASRGTHSMVMKSTDGWNAGTYSPGNNKSGFNAKPAAYALSSSQFPALGNSTNFWTSTNNPSNSGQAWARSMGTDKIGVVRATIGKGMLYSARCIKR